MSALGHKQPLSIQLRKWLLTARSGRPNLFVQAVENCVYRTNKLGMKFIGI